MADVTTLKQAIAQSGPFAVWELMGEDERRAAATALWQNSDRETRIALEQTLAKDMKFRPQTIHRLALDKLVGRLVRLAEDVPENVLFQYLFHLHMADRRPLLGEFLDRAGIPHEDGVLDLPEEFEGPDAAKVGDTATPRWSTSPPSRWPTRSSGRGSTTSSRRTPPMGRPGACRA
jgi:hypothetical protein